MVIIFDKRIQKFDRWKIGSYAQLIFDFFSERKHWLGIAQVAVDFKGSLDQFNISGVELHGLREGNFKVDLR